MQRLAFRLNTMPQHLFLKIRYISICFHLSVYVQPVVAKGTDNLLFEICRCLFFGLRCARLTEAHLYVVLALSLRRQMAGEPGQALRKAGQIFSSSIHG